jgi:FkbM family methyltransferase
LNGADNVTVRAVAISAGPGVADLKLAASMNTGASSLMTRTRYAVRHESVPTESLGTVIGQWAVGRVDLLKMDIEGWEHEAILGSKPLYASGIVRAIILELHDDHLRVRGLDGRPIVEFLASCGYQHAPEFKALVFRLPDAAG